MAAIQLPSTRMAVRAQNALIETTNPASSVTMTINAASVPVSSSKAEGVRANAAPVRKPCNAPITATSAGIDRAMIYRTFDHDAERDWSLLRSDLNALAITYGLPALQSYRADVHSQAIR